MFFNSYTKTDAYYEFIGDDVKYIVPATDVVLVDDESGAISIKLVASRKVIGTVPKN